MDMMLNGNMGIVCTVQRVNIVLKDGTTRLVVARQTDCFEKRDSEWQLIHQHASVPSGGDWDGKVITA
jgi:ketosteroid isomerase-like protein